MRTLLHEIANEVRENVQRTVVSERGGAVGMGADGTDTSQVDKIAEDVILEFIEKKGIEINILSEEVGFIDNGSEETLVVDPIDGTHNAVRGLPFYSVSLAVGKNDTDSTTHGLVMNLEHGTTYYAEKGKGATKDGRPIQTRKPYDHEDGFFSIYLGTHATEKSYELAHGFRRIRCLGAASLDMCAVADGSLDGYYLNYEPRERTIRVVDIAASMLILREAGGEIFTLSGEALNLKYDLSDRANLLALGDPNAREVVL